MSRLAKQILFGAIFLGISAALGWLLYRGIVPAPTCTDGVRNGGEEGPDCGSVCGKTCPAPVMPLENLSVQLIHNDDGSWDALAHLENPNGAYGASRVDYTLIVSDSTNGQVAVRRGDTYVNPSQPRYLLFPLGKPASEPAAALLQFDPAQVEWAGLAIDAAGSVQFAVRNESLQSIAGGMRYQATVANRSRFDFDAVDIIILLQDAAGRTVGAGSTVLRTLLANEERGFVADWPFPVPSAVRTRVFVGTNVFENTNFIRAYGSQERFQGF